MTPQPLVRHLKRGRFPDVGHGCDHCGGTGEVPSRAAAGLYTPCRTCHGTGWIEPKQEAKR